MAAFDTEGEGHMSDMMTALSTVLSFLLGILFYGGLIVVAGVAVVAAIISVVDGIACVLGVGPWKGSRAEAKALKAVAAERQKEREALERQKVEERRLTEQQRRDARISQLERLLGIGRVDDLILDESPVTQRDTRSRQT